MTSRHKRRTEWRTTKNGTWTISLGQRGQRVRLFQIAKDGIFHAELHRDGRKLRMSLKTRSKDAAKESGKALVASMLTGETPQAPRVLRLRDLAADFLSGSQTLMRAKPSTRADAATRAAILCAGINGARDVRTIREDAVRQYERDRLAGGIRYGPKSVTPPVRQRTAQADIKLLKQMLRWACTVTTPAGEPLLDRNPLEYLRVKGERDPRRPVATVAQYEATRDAMRDLQKKYGDAAAASRTRKAAAFFEKKRIAWLRAEFGLWLLRRTGQRQGAVMGLRWSEFDYENEKVTWRAETNKSGRTSHIPYPTEFFSTVREFQRALGAAGGYVFPQENDPTKPAPNETLYQKIMTAEREAGVPKLQQGGTHPYRRMWVSERNHLPRKAVMISGGWKDEATMTRCYDHPDDTDLLAVTQEVTRHGASGGLEAASA